MIRATRWPVRPSAEARFDAMGTRAHVVVVGPNASNRLETAIERVGVLESMWSRFQPTSDISRINRAGGQPIAVAPETIDLVAHGVAAWRLTSGTFDPTMATQLAKLGYDRTFDDLVDPGVDAGPQCDPRGPTSSCGDITIDYERSEVVIPAECGFDPGGIGKGLAADLVTRELIDGGAWGVLVNLGGDLAVKGLPPEGVEWVVTIREPSVTSVELATARLRDSGLATSSSSKRRWTAGGSAHHHILDPTTGSSAASTAILATVIAGEAWWAEVLATSLVVDDQRFNTDEASLCVMSNGAVERRGSFERFEA